MVEDNDTKVDLEELFRDTDIPIDIREKAAFCLVNTSKIPQQDVSLADLLLIEEDARTVTNQPLSENKIPEPPKEPKPRNRPFHKIEKSAVDTKKPHQNADFSPQRLDKERVSPVPRISQIRKSVPATKPNSKYLIQKSHESSFSIERKDVRVRSITPVGKPKFKFNREKRRTKTPSGMMPYTNLNNMSYI